MLNQPLLIWIGEYISLNLLLAIYPQDPAIINQEFGSTLTLTCAIDGNHPYIKDNNITAEDLVFDIPSMQSSAIFTIEDKYTLKLTLNNVRHSGNFKCLIKRRDLPNPQHVCMKEVRIGCKFIKYPIFQRKKRQ